MSHGAGFWDSSALTALFLREPTTLQTRESVKRVSPVVWWATPVEIQSAIARVYRSGGLNDAERAVASDRLTMASRGWQEILPSDELRSVAVDLLSQYPLRAADSLQLAAALMWCRQQARRRTFVCQDLRLGEAAAAVGFTVMRPGSP